MTIRNSALSFLFASLLLTVSCQKTEKLSAFDSKPEVRAPGQIAESFSVAPASTPSDLGLDKTKITLAKSALEKEFLLQTSLIPQPQVAMAHGMKSRVIAFRQRDGKLFMMEATQGHTVTNELPQALILAEMPITEETATSLTFDFNRGMANIFMSGDWHVQDFEGPERDADADFTSINVRSSYIESASITPENQIVIRQIAQMNVPDGGSTTNVSAEVKYYLSPYRPDATFDATRSPTTYDRMAFFEVTPQWTTQGSSLVYASKWNMKKPIVFAISANTPANMKQAVKDGILYWNTVIGRDVVEVIDAPVGVTAPDIKYNVVQWVPWDQGGFAYADAQMDPRTGEILHAQVFFTSGFANIAHLRGKNLLRLQKPGSRPKIGLRGLTAEKMCDYSMNETMVDSVAQVMAAGADDAQILKMTQDYIREVVAHEIGHTLGLRHNFAGSLAATYPLNQRDQMVRDYIKGTLDLKTTVASSSVMDYTLFHEAVIEGDTIGKKVKALDYDKKAIDYLYLGKSYPESEMPIFCTDSHRIMGNYSDCQVFDAGISSVEWTQFAPIELLNHMPETLYGYFLSDRFPTHGETPIAISQSMMPTPENMANNILSMRARSLENFTTSGRLLKVRRQFSVTDGTNEGRIRKDELDYFTGEIDRLGGLESVFSPIGDDVAAQLTARFDKLVTDNMTGTQFGGLPYSFTTEEGDLMRARAAQFFKGLQVSLHRADMVSYTAIGRKMGKFADHDLSDRLAEMFRKRAERYVMTTTSNSINTTIEVDTDVAGVSKVLNVNLPIFAYPYDVRIAAAGLLRPDRALNPAWGLLERTSVSKAYKTQLNSALTVPLEKARPEGMPRAAARWQIENKRVLDAMSSETAIPANLIPLLRPLVAIE